MRTWLNANTEYEGFPIYFRRTNVPTAEFPILQPRYPRLLVLTHILTQVKSNGLPESAYNASLESSKGIPGLARFQGICCRFRATLKPRFRRSSTQ